MTGKQHKIQVIACGIFKREIEELRRREKLSLHCKYLDSMLHMMPALLEYELQENMTESSDNQVVLVFGDCQPRMFEMESKPGICRVAGVNCCEIILGKERFYQLRSEGVFFLLPEWAERWKEVFQKYLGFNKDTAKVFMGDMHTKLLYLDTGVVPVPEKVLQAAAEFCGLPVEILKVDLNHLLKVALDAVATLKKNDELQK